MQKTGAIFFLCLEEETQKDLFSREKKVQLPKFHQEEYTKEQLFREDSYKKPKESFFQKLKTKRAQQIDSNYRLEVMSLTRKTAPPCYEDFFFQNEQVFENEDRDRPGRKRSFGNSSFFRSISEESRSFPSLKNFMRKQARKEILERKKPMKRKLEVLERTSFEFENS